MCMTQLERWKYEREPEVWECNEDEETDDEVDDNIDDLRTHTRDFSRELVSIMQNS